MMEAAKNLDKNKKRNTVGFGLLNPSVQKTLERID